MVRRISVFGLLGLVSLALTTSTWGQVNFTGNYSENFDLIGQGSSPPPGWTVGQLGPSRVTDGGNGFPVNSSPLVVDNGSDTIVGRSFNYGSAGDSDRAIGNTGTTGDGVTQGDRAIQVALVNNTGVPLTFFNLSYFGEQWRVNQSTSTSGAEQLRMFYSTQPASDFVNMGSNFEFFAPQSAPTESPLNGNLPENRTFVTGQFSPPTVIQPGQTFYVRWLDWNDNGTRDHGLAIDDVVFTAVPEPTALGLMLLGTIPLMRRRPTRR